MFREVSGELRIGCKTPSPKREAFFVSYAFGFIKFNVTLDP